MPTRSGKNPYRPRRCKYCKLMYVPVGNVHNADISTFCCRKHKDAYRRNGGMNMERMIEVTTRAVAKAILQDGDFLVALSDHLRSTDAGSMLRKIAREEIDASLDSALARLRESPLVHANLQRMIQEAVRMAPGVT